MPPVDFRGYEPTPLHRLWRILTSTFSLGTWFSVHVRMYWAALVLMPLLFLRWVPAGPGQAIVLVAVCVVGLFLIIWTHEMGHILCGRHYRIRSDLITLGPLGGLAHMNAPANTPHQELWIALAGPAVHLIWLVVFWPIEQLMPAESLWSTWYGFAVWYLVVTNQALLVFNLLPIFPLDGGRALRAILAMRVHPNRATLWAANVGIAGGAILMLLSFGEGRLASTIGFVIGLSCILRSIEEKRMAKHVLIYQQGTARQPWEADPDAWKHGGARQSTKQSTNESSPGWLARRRAARAERIRASKAEELRRLDAEVDAILEKVSEVGMTGLTDKEKTTLKRASEQRRRTGS